jgi:hypothetical protein
VNQLGNPLVNRWANLSGFQLGNQWVIQWVILLEIL